MDEAAASAAVEAMTIDDMDEKDAGPGSTCDTVLVVNALQPIDGNTGATGSPDPPPRLT